MSIGETLAEARRQAGLTVAQVSMRTRIRQTIIRGIESDDYSLCGGDFYARGHIRSIAKVVGVDPGPLIQEYDTALRAPGAISAVSLDELLTTSRSPAHMPTRRPHRNWALVALPLVLIVATGAVLYYILLPGRSASTAPTAGSRPGRAAAHHRAGHPSTSTAHSDPYTRTVVIHLTAVRGCWVEFTTPGGGYLTRSFVPAGGVRTWTFRQPVHMKLSTPDAVKLTVDGRNPLPPGPAGQPLTLSLGPGHLVDVVPAPQPTAPSLTRLTPVSASTLGPDGAGPGDNAQLARLAIDGNPATAWHTDWYTSPRFGNLYPGTGLLLDMGRPVTITAARIRLGDPGAGFQFRVGDAPTLAGLHGVAHAVNAGPVARLRLATPAHGRYVLLWFTRLPTDPSGTYQASVREVYLMGGS